MKMSFIGFKDSPINIFKEMAEDLSKKVSGLELSERFVPFVEDLPIVSLEESEESDFIFVFALVEEEKKDFVTQKLIDVELKSGVRILKSIMVDEFSDLEEEDYIQQKEELVEQQVELILGILFNEIEFEPKDIEFGL
jgi:hypothetical protein